MRLIDTSAWIHALREDGDPEVAARVRTLLETGEAAWCPMVELELWIGARGAHEKRVLKDIRSVVIVLDIDDRVWMEAHALARIARQKGLTAPASDILIAACARRHGAGVEHADQLFERLAEIMA